MPAADLVRWRRAGRGDLAESVVVGHFGERALPAREDGACVHLGVNAERNACAIYRLRPSTCAEFAVGSRQCLEARRERGVR